MTEIIGFATVILAIFLGMLFQNSRFNAIDDRFNAINDRFTSLDQRLDRMQADLAQFYRDLGRHDAKIEILEKKAS